MNSYSQSKKDVVQSVETLLQNTKTGSASIMIIGRDRLGVCYAITAIEGLWEDTVSAAEIGCSLQQQNIYKKNTPVG